MESFKNLKKRNTKILKLISLKRKLPFELKIDKKLFPYVGILNLYSKIEVKYNFNQQELNNLNHSIQLSFK